MYMCLFVYKIVLGIRGYETQHVHVSWQFWLSFDVFSIFIVIDATLDGFIDKALVQEAEFKVKDLEQLVSFPEMYVMLSTEFEFLLFSWLQKNLLAMK